MSSNSVPAKASDTNVAQSEIFKCCIRVRGFEFDFSSVRSKVIENAHVGKSQRLSVLIVRCMFDARICSGRSSESCALGGTRARLPMLHDIF